MQQRRTTSNNPGSLPLTTQDVNSKKQSHRSRLRRGGNLKRNSKNNYFMVGFVTVLLLIVSSVSLFYFFFVGSNSNNSNGNGNVNNGRQRHHNSLVNDLHDKYRSGKTKSSHHDQRHERHHDPRHDRPLPHREQARRRITPEEQNDEWKAHHAGHDGHLEEFENRHNMMHFRPDVNADVNIDRDEIIKHDNHADADPNAKIQEGDNDKNVQNILQQVHDKNIINDNDDDSRKELLKSMPTLSKLSSKTNFIGLFFASSWCNTSQPATDALQNTFQHQSTLLTSHVLKDDNSEKKEIAIIYVSSDRTQEEMEQFISKHADWMIPLSNTNKDDMSNNVKRAFNTCAEEEVNSNINDIERKYGIPRLIILDADMNVITTDGVNDVINDGVDAIKRWKYLKNIKDISNGSDIKNDD